MSDLINGSIAEADGAPSGGKQEMKISTDLTEFKDTLEDAVAGTITTIPATTADMLPYVDSVTGAVQWSTLSELVDGAIVTANVTGTMEDFLSTSTPVAIPIFDTDFTSSTPALVAASGDVGIECNVPVKYDVIFTGDLKAANNLEFFFQVFAGGVAIGRIVTVTGINSTKAVNFTVIATTPSAVNVGDDIEIRCSDSGNNIDEIAGTLHIEFAGL